MDVWRTDIATIARALTGSSHDSWRNDLIAIGGGNSWRMAIRNWASTHGIPASGWKADIIAIAKAETGETPRSWRDAFRLLAGADFDMEIAFFISPPPRQQGVIYRVLADGIITATGEVMA